MELPAALRGNGASNKPLVVVVEDDEDTRANLQDILELDGFQVESAASAAEVTRRDNWGEVAAIILDRRLPDGDALHLIPYLKSVASHSAIVVITGYGDVDGAITALRLGTADYILKPINPDALRASLRRIAEHRNATEALRQSEATLHREREFVERLVEMAPTAIVHLSLDGRIVRFNQWLEQVTGYTLQEVKGDDWFERFIPATERTEMLRVFEDALAHDRVVEHTNEIVTRDGDRVEIRWFSRVLHSTDGAPIGVLANGQDITELRKAQERALQSERLVAIGEAMTGLTHESRNALQRCRACTEMLAVEVEDRPDALDLVDRIQRAANDLQQLFEEVREYAAPIRLNRVDCDLCELWRSVLNELTASQAGKSLTFRESCHTPSCMCLIDRFRISQVLRNILENAIQASPQDGAISVEFDSVEVGEGSAIRMRINDQGPGIPVENRRRVLEPFFTTKAKGTGLGMAICQRIMDAHGGHLTIGDAAGGGTQIALVIPRGTP